MDSMPVRKKSDDTEITSLSARGTARSTVSDQPLSKEEIDKYNRYWHASLYLCLGMLYLKANPLLKEPLSKKHIKPRYVAASQQLRVVC